MTDRELLELAAKAAGYWVDGWIGDRFVVRDFHHAHDNDPREWNPLDNDGDALRLAVKLQIHVQPDGRRAWASTRKVNATEEVGDDPCAATRRAIVRAAAEMGKGDA